MLVQSVLRPDFEMGNEGRQSRRRTRSQTQTEDCCSRRHWSIDGCTGCELSTTSANRNCHPPLFLRQFPTTFAFASASPYTIDSSCATTTIQHVWTKIMQTLSCSRFPISAEKEIFHRSAALRLFFIDLIDAGDKCQMSRSPCPFLRKHGKHNWDDFY